MPRFFWLCYVLLIIARSFSQSNKYSWRLSKISKNAVLRIWTQPLLHIVHIDLDDKNKYESDVDVRWRTEIKDFCFDYSEGQYADIDVDFNGEALLSSISNYSVPFSAPCSSWLQGHENIHSLQLDTTGNPIYVDLTYVIARKSLIVSLQFILTPDSNREYADFLTIREEDDIHESVISFVSRLAPTLSQEEFIEHVKYIKVEIESAIKDTAKSVTTVRRAIRDSVKLYDEVHLVVGDNKIGISYSSSSDRNATTNSLIPSPWIHTTYNVLDITDKRSFLRVLGEIKPETIVAEHVWEHMRYFIVILCLYIY